MTAGAQNRMHEPRPPRRRLSGRVVAGALAAGLVLGGLAACTDDDTRREAPSLASQPVPPDFQVKAKVERHSFIVAIDGGMAPAARADLDAFLATLAPGNPEALHLRVAGSLSKDAQNQLTRFLVADGVEPAKIEFMNPPTPASTGQTNGYRRRARAVPTTRIELAAEVYSVIPPQCPRLARVNISGNDNGIDSNFGCSYVSVFEQMVADPRDLVHGENGGGTDSEETSGAIERLRTDKVKKIENQGSVTLSAGGGQ